MIYWAIKQIARLHPWAFLVASISIIGWDIVVKGNKDDRVEGLVIGTSEYIDRILGEKK